MTLEALLAALLPPQAKATAAALVAALEGLRRPALERWPEPASAPRPDRRESRPETQVAASPDRAAAGPKSALRPVPDGSRAKAPASDPFSPAGPERRSQQAQDALEPAGSGPEAQRGAERTRAAHSRAPARVVGLERDSGQAAPNLAFPPPLPTAAVLEPDRVARAEAAAFPDMYRATDRLDVRSALWTGLIRNDAQPSLAGLSLERGSGLRGALGVQSGLAARVQSDSQTELAAWTGTGAPLPDFAALLQAPARSHPALAAPARDASVQAARPLAVPQERDVWSAAAPWEADAAGLFREVWQNEFAVR